ncbi:MAG: tRNA pseudouridine(38-40) synthase TruA [Anaerolineae bacterium]|nr:tRNA pseudouridine(38-40) synthase TruA [Anaerolineae bacterium]
MVARFRARLAYDGSAYQGFQRQAGNTPTIQGMVESAIEKVTQQRVTVIGAGRTDTGVHAEGQVISFDVVWRHDDEALLRAINANLPDDIALQDIRQHEGFHPRFDAVARVYRYTVVQAAQRQPLLRYRAWQIVRALDDASMVEAASLLVGVHDFAAFGKPPQGTNTVREIYRSQWDTKPTQYGIMHEYRIEATAFLQHMVRRIVSSLIAVGQGTLTIAQFSGALTSGEMLDGVTLAPPHGLVLEAVRYPTDEQLMGRRGRRPPEEI